jgi:hypothetical protein
MKQRRVRPLERIVYHAGDESFLNGVQEENAENASNENKKNTKRVQEVDTEDTEEEVKYVISEVLSNKSKCWISKVRINNVDIKRFR